MAGFNVEFCDVNLTDLSFDYGKLALQIDAIRERRRKVIVWPTALIGYPPDMRKLRAIVDTRFAFADLFLDGCESTLSTIDEGIPGLPHRCETKSLLGSCEMTTTSCYFAHQIVAIEFGFTFCRDPKVADIARMLRNHGLTRSLPTSSPTRFEIEQANPKIDPEFLFACAGTNHRPTEINARFGLLDFARREAVRRHRTRLFDYYASRLDQDRFFLPPANLGHVPFCLPVFVQNADHLERTKFRLRSAGIDTRPVVGGCLPLHPAFQQYAKGKSFPNAEWIHQHGFYIGLHRHLTERDVDRLLTLLHE